MHCGFCTATCPTYVLLGDELDSPRGRIYLIKDMLENSKPASAEVVKHIDRCLSCLACMTTCPSDVHYMHLVDHARRHIEQTYTRPLPDRLLRSLLATVLPRPFLFRLSLIGAWLARPLARFLPGRLRTLFELAPASIPAPSPVDRPQVFPAEGPRRARVALLAGCAQQVLAPEINETTIRLLTRHGVEVVIAQGAGCCGALTHHMGKERPALRDAKANIDAWWRELEGQGLDAVVINASGCGTTVKDYGFMLREDAAYAEKAARISAITKDVTELMTELGLKPPVGVPDLVVAYHSACSMQHGQAIRLAAEAAAERRRASPSRTCPRAISAAARPAPTICCSRRSRPGCATRKVAEHRAAAPGPDRDRQHRLHHPDRGRHRDSDRAYRSPARLGDRRAGAEGARSARARRAPRRGRSDARSRGLSRRGAPRQQGGQPSWQQTPSSTATSTPPRPASGSNSIDSVLAFEGTDRLRFLLEQVVERAHEAGTDLPFTANTAYVNTIPLAQQVKAPGDYHLEWRNRCFTRWNALATVVRANKHTNVGGHIASFASSATLYDVGFNHFWHAPSEEHGGDLRLHPGPLARPASTPAPISRAGSPSRSSTTSARRRAARACPPIRTPG